MADFTRAGLRPSDWWREAVRTGAEQIETITELKRLIDRLEAGESLTEDEWVSLIGDVHRSWRTTSLKSALHPGKRVRKSGVCAGTH